jgi:curved DNA-binding protein CbpA
MKFDSGKDYYGILGVGEDATQEEIDRAFRSQARRSHPDSGGTEAEMKTLNEAHDVLSDSEARKGYDESRRPRRVVYSSSMAFDPEAATKQGTLNIQVSNADLTGLLMGAAACFALGLPFLALVEIQWVFFLWPLRMMAIGVVAVGVLMTYSALRTKQRQLREGESSYSKSTIILQEISFWIFALGVFVIVALVIYYT